MSLLYITSTPMYIINLKVEKLENSVELQSTHILYIIYSKNCNWLESSYIELFFHL